ncbi:unnamed protein product [Dibothriocephalus latus]|uniref:Uncharacterized protein n=1 Tax=Dibothriocephalus latus TaxID=60516 RepID=A0A3P7N197_DIBLA|nr:unnamed protein product [Dibothriocephalus latus]
MPRVEVKRLTDEAIEAYNSEDQIRLSTTKERYRNLLKTPPAKRTKSLKSVRDATYKDEVCTSCFTLLHKFPNHEKELNSLKMEMEELKKSLRLLLKEDKTVMSEFERNKQTSVNVESQTIASTEESEQTPSTRAEKLVASISKPPDAARTSAPTKQHAQNWGEVIFTASGRRLYKSTF